MSTLLKDTIYVRITWHGDVSCDQEITWYDDVNQDSGRHCTVMVDKKGHSWVWAVHQFRVSEFLIRESPDLVYSSSPLVLTVWARSRERQGLKECPYVEESHELPSCAQMFSPMMRNQSLMDEGEKNPT